MYIDYIPADNGSLTAHYAYWRFMHLSNSATLNAGYGYKVFTVTCRAEKQPQLEQAKDFVKRKYGLDMTDKDPWGAYHPSGTLAKLREIVNSLDVAQTIG
jgi:hypothetical protein